MVCSFRDLEDPLKTQSNGTKMLGIDFGWSSSDVAGSPLLTLQVSVFFGISPTLYCEVVEI